ncbi:hypothetical protein JCM9279_002742 [Rhodotorula babjevae]
MARFGLDSDSDSDDPSTSRSPSPSHSPSASPSTRSRSHHDDHDEDAPPRESLYDDDNGDDDDMLSDSGDDDDQGEDQDDLASLDHADDDSFSRSPSSAAPESRSHPATRRPAATRTRSSDDLDLSLNSPSPSPPPPPSTSRAHQQRAAWSSSNQPKPRLGRTSALEPKRAAVMQASLFHQHAHDDDDDGDLILEPAALDRDPKRTRLADSPAPTPAPALCASVGPQPVPAVDPAPFRPHRTYSRPPLADSASAQSRERNLVDAGLALGRSFRVGWGPQGELVSLNGVYSAARRGGPGEQGAPSNSLEVDRVRLVASTDPESSLRLLKLQLAHSDIFPPAADTSSSDSSTSAPLAVPSPDLRFSHYANLFSNPDSAARTQSGSSAKPDPDEAQLFKLASVLFDEVPDLALPESDGPGAPPVTPQQRAHMTALRRRAQLSAWLEDATRPAVEVALQSAPSGSSSSSKSGAARVFALLSGHQVARACDAALESGNVRLATLVAQAGTGFAPPDAQLQGDLALQLAKWREYGVDAPQLVDPAYRRVLELVSGNVGVSEGRLGGDDGLGVPETHVLEGLTWVQALAAGLWYAPDPEQGDGEAAVRDAVEAYERAFAHDERVAQPVPAYLASPSSATTSSSPSWAPLPSEVRSPPRAGTFHLLKLFASPVHALEDALAPRNFGLAPTDYRLTWHLYVLLSRVLRRRDWEDREVLDEGEGEAMREEGAGEGEGEGAATREGNSVTADRVTEAYAAQLEAVGEWDWAAFVLLHIELEDRRTKAIKNLLARHVDELADSTSPRVDFLLSTLHLPAVWLSSAQADTALCEPSLRFKAYTLLLAAQRAPEAHAIAWAELAPEALLRNDPLLVRRLLAPFHADGDASAGHVAGWSDAGGVFVAYLDVLDRAAEALPHALDGQQALDVARVLARTQRLAQRARTEPRTRGRTQLRLALDDMVGRLVVLAKAAAGAGAPAALERAQPSLLPDSERATWIQGANKAFWEASFARAVSA